MGMYTCDTTTDDQISIYHGQEWLLYAVTNFDVGAQET